MGVWAYPFKDIKTAKKFSSKMKKPWIAKVEKEDEGYYKWSAKDLGFLGTDTLYGDDSLWDYLGEISDKKKKDFDIRPYVEECLMYHVWFFEHQLETEFDPKALQIVHDSLSVKFKNKDIEPYVFELKNLASTLKDNSVKVLSLEVWAQDPKLKWTSHNMPMGVPKTHLSKKIFALALKTESKVSMDKILKDKFQIIKITPFKTYTKNFGYTIFLEIKKTGSKVQQKNTKIADKYKTISKSKSKAVASSENVKIQYKMTCTAKGSNKFWNAKRVKNKVYLVFGAIGYEGRTTVKTFASEDIAIDFMAEKVKEKLKKNYKNV